MICGIGYIIYNYTSGIIKNDPKSGGFKITYSNLYLTQGIESPSSKQSKSDRLWYNTGCRQQFVFVNTGCHNKMLTVFDI